MMLMASSMRIRRLMGIAAAGAMLLSGSAPAASAVVGTSADVARPVLDTVLFGASYYDEYSPYERLDADVKMMQAAGTTVVRIGESTWGTMETSPGVFDFTHIDRVLRAMGRAHIKVIVGTPTYAVPTWLAREHPDVLAITPTGQSKFGFRQNMDITNPHYREAAERVIRALVAHVKDSPAVIGFQVDNETKPYDVVGPGVQKGFAKFLKARFPDLDGLNAAFGLNYWSNRINDWADLPSADGSSNASFSGAFAEYQRSLVTDFLGWQAGIVREIKRPDQFVTQNFDLANGGIQSQVDHFAAARALDVAGIDIYHGSQDQLSGTEIAFGGDLARSIKGGRNYLLLETQAQGIPGWVPYPGQLRLQAFSHFASGANMVSYWHWGSTANGFETYFSGLLSHDYQPNPTYEEARTIGADLKRIGPDIVNLRKDNKVAVYFSNRALTAFEAFKFGWNGSKESYNEILRPFYDALYRMNLEADLIDPSVTDISKYKLIVVPCLYAATDDELRRLNAFVKAGGHVVETFKSGFADETVKTRSSAQPGILSEAAGVTYDQYSLPSDVTLKGNPFGVSAEDNTVRLWMEFLKPTTATVLASYDHPVWGRYAAATRNRYGKGTATYIGFMPSGAVIEKILADAARDAGVWGPAQAAHYPLIVRSGVTAKGRTLHYLLNYSAKPASFDYRFGVGIDLLTGKPIADRKPVALGPWGVAIVEEARR